ncbi:hypothetical protein D3C72_976720 [compost metagenome]
MQSAVGIPQRESGIVYKSRIFIHFLVSSSVIAIGIIKNRRRKHGMVQRRVENCFGIGIALNINFP